MIDTDTLCQLPYFAELSKQQLDWLTKHGNQITLSPGDLLVSEGDSPEYFYILLKGELQSTQNIGEEEIGFASYKPGHFLGEMHIALESAHVSSVRALVHCQLFELKKGVFFQMMAMFPSVKHFIVSKMEQHFHAAQGIQYHEKLVGLGTLAAGLAHELNNPAVAGNRAAEHLRNHLERLQPLRTDVQTTLLSDLQLDVISRATAPLFSDPFEKSVQESTESFLLDPLERSDQEDRILSWLAARGINHCWELAPTLVEANLHIDWLDRVAARVDAESLPGVLTWIGSTLAVNRLLSEIQHCTTRISEMVSAVKEYSYMDQAPLQEVDIHEGINCTLLMLGHKIKRGITLFCEYDQRLPRICVYGSALNQVWTNIIDNAIDAIDAIDGQGQLWIRTMREDECVLVEIIDNGSGIPPEIQSRIFEPFFTIKGVGQGTGLGLSTSYRIVVEIHQGSIRVTSKPGKTCFQVRLPLKQCA